VQSRIYDQQLGSGVAADVADLRRRQPDIHRDQHRARQRHPKMCDQKFWNVGQQVGHAIAWFNATCPQSVSQPRRGRGELSVTDPAIAVHDGGLFGVNLRRAFQECQRRKRGEPNVWTPCHNFIMPRRTTPIKTVFRVMSV
jgi:hypothetical protein